MTWRLGQPPGGTRSWDALRGEEAHLLGVPASGGVGQFNGDEDLVGGDDALGL